MRTVLKISTVLSWINMIIWGIVILACLLMDLALQSFPVLVAVFLLSTILLHNYAALQLHKSIRNPAVKLSSQTPVGIRFIGFVALFFGVSFLANGVTILQNPTEYIKLVQSMQDQSAQGKVFILTVGMARIMGCIALLLGLCIAVNVFLNLRLLRWYRFMQDDEK